LVSTSDHPLGDDDVLELIGERLSAEGDKLVCTLAHERVEYNVGRKGVQIQRSPQVSSEVISAELGPLNEQLLKAFGGVGANRKDKLRQAGYLGRIIMTTLAGHKGRELKVLDAACGRSYLGLMLVLLLKSIITRR
jgi:hypothetical protein